MLCPCPQGDSAKKGDATMRTGPQGNAGNLDRMESGRPRKGHELWLLKKIIIIIKPPK